MMISYILVGISFPVLIKLYLKHGISLRPKYFLRALLLIPNSVFSVLLVVVEKIKFGRKTDQVIITKSPVFIIGHWRTGTTFLHQLISLDKQFTSPTFVQTVIPDHFLFSTRYYVPVMKRVMPKKRPMDEVELKPFDPMEDEFALIRMGSASPLEKLLFPSKNKEFMPDLSEFIPEGKELTRWKKNFLIFIKKITLLTGKQVVFKNPYHTPRMIMLSKMFPGARFIHIYRHPYKVIPSAINMWNIVAAENSLKKGWKKQGISDTARILDEFWTFVSKESIKLEKNEFSEVKYEKLETDPVNELKRIYHELNLEFTEEFEKKIIRFIEEKKNYKKNTFEMSEVDKNIIYNRLSHHFQAFGYESTL